MQIPQRRSELTNRYAAPPDPYVSPQTHTELQAELTRLQQHVRPSAVVELTRTREMGDLSENAAYTQAKARVGGIDRRVMEIQERLRTAIIVSPGATADGRVRIGTTVDVEVRGNQRTYVLTGSTEADPSTGRLSHLSPLGSALMGKKVGDTATITGPAGSPVEYRVLAVR